MKNALKEAQKLIKDFRGKRAEDLEAIRLKLKEYNDVLETVKKTMDEATEVMDLSGYEKAKSEKKTAEAAIEMYSTRYRQIETAEYTTEEKSDEFIDGVLSYEQERGEQFKTEAEKLYTSLRELLETYLSDIAEAEAVINEWTTTIHANYRSATTTYADGSHRAPHPVPVHSAPFKGCKEALRLEMYFRDIDEGKNPVSMV